MEEISQDNTAAGNGAVTSRKSGIGVMTTIEHFRLIAAIHSAMTSNKMEARHGEKEKSRAF